MRYQNGRFQWQTRCKLSNYTNRALVQKQQGGGFILWMWRLKTHLHCQTEPDCMPYYHSTTVSDTAWHTQSSCLNNPRTYQTAVSSHGCCMQTLIRPRYFLALTVLHLLCICWLTFWHAYTVKRIFIDWPFISNQIKSNLFANTKYERKKQTKNQK